MARLAVRWRTYGRLLSLEPFDLSTSEGRSDERHRRILLTTMAVILAKAISICTALISVPLTLHYLGAERYGMWLTLSAFIAVMSFADLGMGSGLLTRIAAANGRGDREAIGGYISSAFGVLSSIAVVALAALWIAYSTTPWYALFNVKSLLAVAESGPSIAVFATCLALSLPAAVVQRVQAGLQQGFTSSLWQCAGSLSALAGILVCTWLQLGLPWLVASYVGAPLVVTTINAVTFFAANKDIAPRVSKFSSASARAILSTGVLFLILQIVAAVSYSSDALIIAHVLGPQSVQQYAVPERLFNMVGQVLVMALSPLWPAYGEALAREDHPWVRRTFLRSSAIAIGAATLGASALGLTAPWLLHLWVGSAVTADPVLIGGFVLWKVIEAAANVTAMLLNAAHLVKLQVVVALLAGVVTVGLKFLLIPIIGVAGGVWASIVGFCVCAFIPLGLGCLKVLRLGVSNGR